MERSKTYRPKFGYDIRIHPERPTVRAAGGHICAVRGCGQQADINAPKSRANLEDRHWLCRDHVREVNARWDFFAGMSAEQIEKFRVEAIVGHRPTWPLGKRAAPFPGENVEDRSSGWNYQIDDGFTILGDVESALPPKKTRLTKGQLDALAVLNLEENATLVAIKARYKELVKRFHPDANGGNRATEERLRQVIKAYGHLKATGFV